MATNDYQSYFLTNQPESYGLPTGQRNQSQKKKQFYLSTSPMPYQTMSNNFNPLKSQTFEAVMATTNHDEEPSTEEILMANTSNLFRRADKRGQARNRWPIPLETTKFGAIDALKRIRMTKLIKKPAANRLTVGRHFVENFNGSFASQGSQMSDGRNSSLERIANEQSTPLTLYDYQQPRGTSSLFAKGTGSLRHPRGSLLEDPFLGSFNIQEEPSRPRAIDQVARKGSMPLMPSGPMKLPSKLANGSIGSQSSLKLKSKAYPEQPTSDYLPALDQDQSLQIEGLKKMTELAQQKYETVATIENELITLQDVGLPQKSEKRAMSGMGGTSPGDYTSTVDDRSPITFENLSRTSSSKHLQEGGVSKKKQAVMEHIKKKSSEQSLNSLQSTVIAKKNLKALKTERQGLHQAVEKEILHFPAEQKALIMKQFAEKAQQHKPFNRLPVLPEGKGRQKTKNVAHKESDHEYSPRSFFKRFGYINYPECEKLAPNKYMVNYSKNLGHNRVKSTINIKEMKKQLGQIDQANRSLDNTARNSQEATNPRASKLRSLQVSPTDKAKDLDILDNVNDLVDPVEKSEKKAGEGIVLKGAEALQLKKRSTTLNTNASIGTMAKQLSIPVNTSMIKSKWEEMAVIRTAMRNSVTLWKKGLEILGSDPEDSDDTVSYKQEYEFETASESSGGYYRSNHTIQEQFDLNAFLDGDKSQPGTQRESFSLRKPGDAVNRLKGLLKESFEQRFIRKRNKKVKLKPQEIKAVQKFEDFGGQMMLIKDYSSKNPLFKPMASYEKYYINKKDYVIPLKKLRKGGEKETPAIRSLIARRNAFKNRFQQMSYLDDHFSSLLHKKKSPAETDALAFLKEVSSSRSEDNNIVSAENTMIDKLEIGQIKEVSSGNESSLQSSSFPTSRAENQGEFYSFDNQTNPSNANTPLIRPMEVPQLLKHSSDVSGIRPRASSMARSQFKGRQLQHYGEQESPEHSPPPRQPSQAAQHQYLAAPRVSNKIQKMQERVRALRRESLEGLSKVNNQILQITKEESKNKFSQISELGVTNESSQMSSSLKSSSQVKSRNQTPDSGYSFEQSSDNSKSYLDSNYSSSEKESPTLGEMMPFEKKMEHERRKSKKEKDHAALLKKKMKEMVEQQEKLRIKLENQINDDEKVKQFIRKATTRDYTDKLKDVKDKVKSRPRSKLVKEFLDDKYQDRNKEKFSLLKQYEEEQGIIPTLVSSDNASEEELKEVEGMDSKLVGEKALIHKYDIVNNLDSLAQTLVAQKKKTRSPLIKVLMESTKNGSPAKDLGFAKKSATEELNLEMIHLKPDMFTAVLGSLPLASHFRELNFAKCNMTSRMCEGLMRNLPLHVTLLDLSGNHKAFTDETIRVFCDKILENSNMSLRQFSFANCRVSDAQAAIIGRSILENSSVRHLDLSNNDIRGTGAKSLGHCLKYNNALQILCLSWNPIGFEGGSHLADGLLENECLKCLDVSFCKMGTLKSEWRQLHQNEMRDSKGNVISLVKQKFFGQIQKRKTSIRKGRSTMRRNRTIENSSADIWRDVFLKPNSPLIHINFSHNGFTEQELAVIWEGLRKNQSLLGVHLQAGEVLRNTLGFMKTNGLDVLPSDFDKKPVFTRITSTSNSTPSKKPGAQIQPLTGNTRCWLCERWAGSKKISLDLSPARKTTDGLDLPRGSTLVRENPRLKRFSQNVPSLQFQRKNLMKL